MSRERAIRVIKVGGSLLDWPQLPTALRSWLAMQEPALNVLLCGCGPFGDVIRQADQHFSLGEEHSHWLCIDALSVTARLLAAIFPDAPHCDRYVQLTSRIAARDPGTMIFDPQEFLTDHEAALPGRALPHTWSVSTDSIAARLAQVIEADELILLKSANAPHAASLGDLAASGLVDRHFLLAASSLRSVRLVNLREAD
jgi:5-(aminomethyl)-3-furanmethanol phosphate kinase